MTREDIIAMAQQAWLDDNGVDSFVRISQIAYAAGVKAMHKENAELAVGQCLNVVGDEGGTPYCRLHEVNQELLEALQRIKHHFDTDEYAWKIAEAAITKATGEKP